MDKKMVEITELFMDKVLQIIKKETNLTIKSIIVVSLSAKLFARIRCLINFK